MADARLVRVRSQDEERPLRGWLTRIRWRRRGAWLWPLFIALTIADAVIGHALPPQGETQSLVAAALLACVLNLIAVVLCTRPAGAALRRFRPDLPRVVARDYAGRGLIVAVAVALAMAGLLHHPTIIAHQRVMRDAIGRAQAWIGDRAPAEFRRNVQFVNAFMIDTGIYRICVPSAVGTGSYCVIVKESLPFQRSVSFAGTESNAVFAAGVG
jgi:hypothetical protein